MFEIVEHEVRTVWVPVDYTNSTAQTLYVGQLVALGLQSAGNYAGAIAYPGSGTSSPKMGLPFGVVVGNNNKDPLYSSTYSAEYIISVQSQANQIARKTSMASEGNGMFNPADPQAMVKVAVIGGQTVLKGAIFNGSYGTVPSVAVVTTADAEGDGITCATTGFDFTNVAYNSYFYCRKGANRGLYRGNAYDTAAGTAQKTLYGPYWPYDLAVGDQFVGVNIGMGSTKAFIDSVGMYFDCSNALTYYNYINVLEMNLETAGREYVIFQFDNKYFYRE